MQAGGRDSACEGRRHLILHQRDEGGHHDRETAEDQRGNLEAERFSPSSGQHRKGVPPAKYRSEHADLRGTELPVPEMLLQQGARLGHGVGHAPTSRRPAAVAHRRAATRTYFVEAAGVVSEVLAYPPSQERRPRVVRELYRGA
jgi:hypothetical protein